MKRTLSLIMVFVSLICLCPAAKVAGIENFCSVQTYSSGLFCDVAEGSWYESSVSYVYELGLMVGDQAGRFNPDGYVSYAEMLALAARLHKIYNFGSAEFSMVDPWYKMYESYCLKNGIISNSPIDYNVPVTRGEFASVLSRALPSSTRPAIRPVEDNQISDVCMTDPYAAEIYELYRAGILSGSNSYGTFRVNLPIQRSAVAAIIARMVNPTLRSDKPLEIRTFPDVALQSYADNDQFTNSAMVGNSLVQGMMLSSELRGTMKFHCYQSLTVFTIGPKVDEVCQGNYDSVYVQLGINEIYLEPETFAAAYGRVIDRIRIALPEANIYIMAITPVTKAVSDSGSVTMYKIRKMNAALYELAAEKECWYLDTCELLCDSSGYLPEEYAGWDGSPHLSQAGYRAWEKVIRTYYI